MSDDMGEDDRRAWAYLSRVAEPPSTELAALVRRVGPIEAAERIRRAEAPDRLVRDTEARRGLDQAARDLEILDRLDGRLLTADDPHWPALAFAAFAGVDIRTRPQGRAPMVLWVRGPLDLALVSARSCALVGTRASSAYGEYVAADLAAGLAAREVAVVSGGAYGIDGAAHRAALACDGATVAVLASGIDVRYPAGHAELFGRLAEEGLLVTEYPPGSRPTRHRFLTRNRLVAALAGATVVVEAGVRSGAANTAAWARALGRAVCAVPGPVTSSSSVGCHELLRGGAELVSRADDVVELVGAIGELAADLPRPGAVLDGSVSSNAGCTTRFRRAARAPPRRSRSPPGWRPPRCWRR